MKIRHLHTIPTWIIVIEQAENMQNFETERNHYFSILDISITLINTDKNWKRDKSYLLNNFF